MQTRRTQVQTVAFFIMSSTLLAWPLTGRGQNKAEHRIGVRVVNGVGEFYDRVTGAKFVPRGNNYIRLGPQTTLDGQHIITHSTFSPGIYDPARATQALQRMHADGYNIVRAWLSVYAIGDPSSGLSSAYLK